GAVLFARGQRLDLLQARIPRLARGHAPVDGDRARIRHGAAAGAGEEDLARGAGAAAEEARVLIVLRVVARVEHLAQALDLHAVLAAVLVELAHLLKDIRHLVDRVLAALGRAAVAGDAAHLDADLHAAAVAAVHAAVGRLRGDDELRRHA